MAIRRKKKTKAAAKVELDEKGAYWDPPEFKYEAKRTVGDRWIKVSGGASCAAVHGSSELFSVTPDWARIRNKEEALFVAKHLEAWARSVPKQESPGEAGAGEE